MPRPDGVFCYSDRIALGAMRAMLDLGLRVPEDIAVVGWGNVPYADSLRVPLTSVDLDCKKLGEPRRKWSREFCSGEVVQHPETG